MAPKKEEKVAEPLSVVLKRAGKKALGGGIAGAMAMVAQVALLMWMRTVMNYQHANGLTTWEAITTLYAEGGLARLYQGWQAALLQAPISRFGDTAANALMLSLLANIAIPEAAKTFCSSWAAAGFRILITPIDAFKTTLQVQGTAGLAVLSERIAAEGVLTLWSGALATSFATFMGHYPWFVTFNYLNAKWEEPKGGVMKLVRRAIIGVCSSCVSDVVSNSIRVVKTKKQARARFAMRDARLSRGAILEAAPTPCCARTLPADAPIPAALPQTAKEALTYMATVMAIIEEDGPQGLFLRGLGTKLITNAVSAMLFTVLWKFFEEKLTAKKDDKKKAA